MNIIPLHGDLGARDEDDLGGKGRGLLRLLRAGARVPRAVVVPPQADAEAAAEDIMRHFNDSDGVKAYAVRSSAMVEDGQERSWAGQFGSLLRVEGKRGLVDALTKVRVLSAEKRDALAAYADGDEIDIRMSVIVQEMVEAECAGVLFTCDPVSGSRNHLVMEMVGGTAEHLLGGSEAGWRLVMDREGAVIESMGDAVGDAALPARVAGEALAIEEVLEKDLREGPFDFEWAFRGGELFWLQVRAVTALGRPPGSGEEIHLMDPGELPDVKEGETHWTSLNAREALPWVLSPLVASFMLQSTDEGFYELIHLFGPSRDTLRKFRTTELFSGRAFLNITSLQSLFRFLPISNTKAITEKFLSGSSTEQPKLTLSLALVRPLITLIVTDMRLPALFKDLEVRDRRKWRLPDNEALRGMKDKELAGLIDDILDVREPFFVHLLGGMRHMNYFSLLQRICEKFGEHPSTFLQGLGTLHFASAAEHMRNLAHALDSNRALLFDESFTLRDDWRDALEKRQELRPFRELFKRYLDEFGHLGDGAVEISRKNYRDEPEKVLALVAEILRSGDAADRSEYLGRLSTRRNEAAAALKARMSFLERLKFDFIVKMMHQAAPFRENMKFLLSRRLGIFKVFLGEMAARLIDEGVLESHEDIYFLTCSELKGLLGTPERSSMRTVIEKRKREHQRLLLLPCPLHRIEGPGGVRLYYPARAVKGRAFSGTGASGGKALGKARVITNLREASRLLPGEILVTTATEPSWTPLFSIAAAVVVEIGSALSHGAVVAREIGIPAVLGLPGIVGAVRDGDLLLVDGAAGSVRIMEPEAS